MPHLDATAIVTDVEGLEFLGKVLDGNMGVAAALPRRRAFARIGKAARPAAFVPAEINRPRTTVGLSETA